MCAALPYYYTLHRCSANGTRLTGALVDAKIILKIAAPVDPINACAVPQDSLIQHLADRIQQMHRLLFGYTL